MQAAAQPAIAPRAATHPNGPFVGPRPFTHDDSMFFFGRQREAIDLANMVAACSLTVVYGPSGSGKSSLINARLGEALDEIEPDWVVITFSSWQSGFEAALLDRIGSALGQPGTLAAAGGPPPSAPQSAPTLANLAPTLLAFARDEDRPVTLILDQFEEYFLYNDPGTPFETALARLANRRSSPVHLVLCLRSDRLFLLDRLRTQVPDILQNLFCVEPLGAEGARDAVRLPVARYGEITGQAITVDPELVEAVVQGASEREIFRRLPLHGRGEPAGGAASSGPAGPASPVRIVAPFLQLALEAIWRRDVNENEGTRLRLQTLRELAGASADTAKEALVGRLAQAHFDSVLSQRTPEEQEVCAKLFDRMVTYSGTKVAIAFPDDLSFLSSHQRELAGTLLTWLSAPGPGRFVRPVASEEPTPEAPGKYACRYEIVHDALAVPILDWVVRRREQAAVAEAAAEAAEREADERQRREVAEARQQAERASREAAEARAAGEQSRRRLWQLGSILVTLTIVLAAGYGYGNAEYRARKADISRFLAFAARDDASEFRTRLLLAVAALRKTQGVWRMAFATQRRAARETIKQVVLRSPRYGGEYLAVGADGSGAKVATVSASAEPDQGLQTLALDPGTTEPVPPPANFLTTQAVSRNANLAQMPVPVVGFLEGQATPALIKGGILYYQLAGAAKGAWQQVDLADLLPAQILGLPGLCIPDITAGAVQVACYGSGLNDLSVARLRPAAPSRPNVFELAGGVSAISLNQPGPRFTPAFSPWLASPPRDRWAALFRSDETNPGTEGQYQQRGITVGALGSDKTDNAVWSELVDKPAGWVQKAIDSSGASAVPSIAFSDDGSSVVLRVERKIFIAPLDAEGGRLVSEKGSDPLQAPSNLAAGAARGFWNARPLLAAVRLPQDQPGARWRFAWLFPDGLAVLESRTAGELLSVRQPWRAAQPERKSELMLTGVVAGSKLSFSRYGRFLTLVSPDWTRRVVKVRVWDLSDASVQEIKDLNDDARLVELACDRARLDSGTNRFDAAEKITWTGVDGPQPCGTP